MWLWQGFATCEGEGSHVSLRSSRLKGGGVNRGPLYVLSFTLQLSKIADARGFNECW